MVNGELTVYGDKQPFGEVSVVHADGIQTDLNHPVLTHTTASLQHYVRTYMKLFEGKEKCAAPKAVGLEVSASTWDNPPLIDTCK